MKFRIKDEDGKDYTVEEIIEKKSEDVEPEVETKDEEVISLTQEEIDNLKLLLPLAPHVEKLVALVQEKADETVEDEDEDEDEDFDEEITEEEKEVNDEEVIETCEKETMPARDSKSSFGSLETKNVNIDDSLEDSVSQAWAKRYGGIK